jgi:hypothetical protein
MKLHLTASALTVFSKYLIINKLEARIESVTTISVRLK